MVAIVSLTQPEGRTNHRGVSELEPFRAHHVTSRSNSGTARDSSEQIAQRLHISARTVETYYSRIIDKMRLAGMKELRRYAIQQGHERPERSSPP